MNFRTYIALTLLAILIIFNSCSVKKRSYQKGYYIDWAFKKGVKKSSQTELTLIDKKRPASETNKTNDEVAAASTLKNEPELLAGKNKAILSLKDTCGDVMLFKNGDILKVKVLEVTEEIIKYKRCDNPNGPSYTVGKEKVSTITYTNGFKENIEPPPLKKIEVVKNEDKEYPNEVVWATLLPFVLSGIGVFISMGFALKAKKKILAHPDKYKGLRLAKFMFAFDIIIVAAFVAVMILFIGGSGNLSALLYIMLATLLAIIGAAIYYGFS